MFNLSCVFNILIWLPTLNTSSALLWKRELILESEILRIEILPVLDTAKGGFWIPGIKCNTFSDYGWLEK